MNAPSHDLADYLETSAAVTGLVHGTDLFTGFEPDTASIPDAIVTLYDTGGEPPQSGFRYDFPTIQARVRSAKEGQLTGYAMAESIKEALHGLNGITINSTRYIGIWAMGDIHQMPMDENTRAIFTINFRIQRTLT